jgi:hypothetical protein
LPRERVVVCDNGSGVRRPDIHPHLPPSLPFAMLAGRVLGGFACHPQLLNVEEDSRLVCVCGDALSRWDTQTLCISHRAECSHQLSVS